MNILKYFKKIIEHYKKRKKIEIERKVLEKKVKEFDKINSEKTYTSGDGVLTWY